MSTYHFCLDCEHLKIRIVPGLHDQKVEEMSCPARFNPMEGKWLPHEGTNPHECPRNEIFMQLQKQSADRLLR